jgi:hypothetical protein
LKYYLEPLRKLQLETDKIILSDEYTFVFFKTLVRSIEKIQNIPPLLQSITIYDSINDVYKKGFI